MKKSLLALIVVLASGLPYAVTAQTLKDGLDKGVSGIKKGVEKIGQGAANVADSVGETVDSSVDLMTNDPTPDETRAKLDAMAAETMERLLAEEPDARAILEESAGYAVFDTRKVTLIGFTGGAGRGVAVAPTGERTYMNMGTAGVGFAFGLGGFESQLVFMFEDTDSFNDFITNGYDATAEAGAMFGDDEESADFRFVDGRAVFVLTKRGWRVSATAAGTRYWPASTLN